MHHVNLKRRRAKILRFVAYTVTISLSVLTTIVLLYVALGYRLDRKSGHVVQSGLLLVDTKPVAGALYINNELKDQQAPGRFVLSAGEYNLAIKRDGYRDWSKSVLVKASGVREVNYPILLPSTITPRSVASFDAPSIESQSQNKKFLLTYVNGSSEMQLFELDPKQPKQIALALNDAFTREAGKLGTINVVEWALNNKQVLLSHTLPSGRSEFISLDVTKPQEAINVSDLYPDTPLSDVHYIGGNTKQIYGLVSGVLRKYSLESTESELVMENITSYQPYSDDTILFTRIAADALLEVGLKKDDDVSVIERELDPATAPLLAYAKYDGHFYFVIAQSNGSSVTIYRDPTKKPVLAKQLPFVKFTFANTKKVKFGDSSRFVLVQNGPTFITYDLEELILFEVAPEIVPAEGSTYEWVDAYHMTITGSGGMTYLMEYDGKNQQQLVGVRAGSKPYFTSNFQHMYHFADSGQATQLEMTSLVVGKE